MSKSITVVLPDEIEARLEEVSSAKGVSAPEWVSDAIRRQLFLHEFEEIRAEAMAELDSRGVQLTDEDVFRIVS